MTVLAPPALDLPLSTALREGSRREHTEAEDAPFMAELLAGRVDAAGYTAYLLRLRPVYAALEEVGACHAAEPAVAAVHDQALARLAALDADLATWSALAGAPVHDPRTDPRATSPAAAAYRERILAGADWLPLYVAHHYTRYLGDLSGGQAIGRILDREFDLAGRGVEFYRFAAIPKPKPYKDAYRARLDSLVLTATEKQRVVEEVRVAFRLNHALFSELGARLDEFRRA